MQLIEFSTDRIFYKLAAGVGNQKEKISPAMLIFYLWNNVNIGLKNVLLLDYFIHAPLFFWEKILLQDTSLSTSWIVVTQDRELKYELLMFSFLIYGLSYLALSIYELVEYLRRQKKTSSRFMVRRLLVKGALRLGLKLLIQFGWFYFLTEWVEDLDYDSALMYLLLLSFLFTAVSAVFNLLLYITTLVNNHLPAGQQNKHLAVSFILLQEAASFILVLTVL